MHESAPIYEIASDTPDCVSEESIQAFYTERHLSDLVITESLNAAYATLASARKAAHDAVEFESLRSEALDAAERSLLLGGAIDGKNAELRAAQTFNRTETERRLLSEARSRRRRAELVLQIAQDEVQRLRAITALITSQN